jgi:multiple sugar transport system permease protein
MMMFTITIIFVVLVVLFFKFKLSKNSEIDRRIKEHTPSKKTAFIGDSAEETLRREKVMKTLKYIVSYTFLGLLAFAMLVPFYWMIATSLKTEAEIELAIPTFYPHLLALSNYPKAIARLNAGRLIFNTVWVGVWSTAGTLITTVFAAFAFSRIAFKGRELIFNIFLTTMMIPGEMMTISNYITVVGYLKGQDKFWSMIIPFLISVYYIYLLRQNFKQIPNELYYAAKVDGTGDFKYLLKVMVPIAMPTLITITILKMMGSWNSYVWPMMVTTKDDMRLITTGLRRAFTSEEGRTVQGLQMAGSTIVTAPLLVVFVVLRKYIMRGVSRSGIKG